MDGGMRWQHHSAYDDLSNISVTELERVIDAVGGVTSELARSTTWSFPRGMAPEYRKPIALMAREMFGIRAQ